LAVEHPDVPDAAYPAAAELRKKFSFGWHTFKVAGAASAMAVDDIQAELPAGSCARAARSDEAEPAQRVPAVRQLTTSWRSARRSRVLRPGDRRRRQGPRQDAAGDPPQDRALPRHERVQRRRHGRAARQLKTQLFGVTGEDLASQPDLAEKLSQACAVLKQELLDPNSVSAVTGRLKRRVVLD
jgi:hypothetical protein